MNRVRILIVANETAAGEHLREAATQAMSQGEVEFDLVVPASPPRDGFVWTEGEATANAAKQLTEALTKLKAAGARIEGWVGDPSPIAAIRSAWEEGSYDRIIISTLPPGISRWIAMDLPHRVGREFNCDVTHLVAEDSRVRDVLWRA